MTWIYIPYQSVQDTVESNWDSSKLSIELESSVTWKTKSRKQKSWLNALKKEDLTKHLYGLTYDPSMRNYFVEKWTSSLEDSLANRTASQVNNKESKTQENYQEKYSVLQTNSGDQLSFLRMSPASSDSTGTTSDQSFKQWDTGLKKSSLRREKQGPHIKGKEYLSWLMQKPQGSMGGTKQWRTVSAQESEGGVKDFNKKVGLGGQTAQLKLRDQTANWPTPTTQEIPHENMELTETGRRKTKDGKDSHSLNLQDRSSTWSTPSAGEHKSRMQGDSQASKNVTTQARYWPTASARDYKGGSVDTVEWVNGTPVRISNTTQDRHGITLDTAILLFPSIHQDQMMTKDGHTCSPKCRRLNPLFAEWLMGLPLGWTNGYGASAMELYQLWQVQLGFILLSVLDKEE